MGNFRSVKTKCFVKYLLAHGFVYDRTSSSHHIYIKKGHRSIIIQGNEKDVPGLHIRTNASSMKVTADSIYIWIENNC